MRDGLKALGIEDVEVVVGNSRWRTFTISVDGQERLRRKGWGKHVPTPEEALLFIRGDVPGE